MSRRSIHILSAAVAAVLGAALAQADVTVEGRVVLPKAEQTPVMNKRYSMTARGGMLSPHVPRAIVYLEGPFPRPATLPTVEIAQKDIAFVPDIVPIEAGTRVEFPNRDTTDHSIYSSSAAQSFNLGRFGPSEQPVPAKVFSTPGLVTVRCDIHENMRANILVLDTPYFVVTDAKGRYRLSGLPTGHHVLKVWLNGKTTLERPVDLQEGSALSADFP